MARRPKRGLRGAGHVRRLLKRMPDSVAAEIVAVMEQVRPKAVTMARWEAPTRSGGLKRAISGRVYPRSLRFRVGLLTKRVQRKFFYGHILEVGRKAKTVQVRRSKPSGGVTQYALRVKPIPSQRYDMTGGKNRRRIRELFRQPLRQIWDKALRNAAGHAGATDD